MHDQQRYEHAQVAEDVAHYILSELLRVARQTHGEDHFSSKSMLLNAWIIANHAAQSRFEEGARIGQFQPSGRVDYDRIQSDVDAWFAGSEDPSRAPE